MSKKAQAVQRSRFFYGWHVLGVTMVGGFLGAGISQVVGGVMLKPLSEEFGWSRTAITTAITGGSIASGLLSVLIGRLADRHGPRVLTSVGALVVVGAYAILATMTQLWQLYLAYVVGRAVSGNSLGGVVSRTTAVNWFYRKRGRAIGMVALAIPLGGAVLAPLAQFIIEVANFRMVYAVFGALTLVLVVGPAALVLRRRPEDMGLLPDGASAEEAQTGQTGRGRVLPQGSDWTLREALRNNALWLLVAAQVLAVTGNGAIGFHMVAYLTDKGLAATMAVTVLSVYALSGALGNGIWGFLTEKFSERGLIIAAMIISGGLVLYLLWVRTPAAAFVFAVGFGLAARGEGTLMAMLLAQYYGRSSYGAIQGFMNPFQMIGLGLGPIVASMAYDSTSTYTTVFLVFCGTFFSSAAVVWITKRPLHPATLTKGELDGI